MCELTEEKFHVYEKYIREGAEEGREVRRGGEGKGKGGRVAGGREGVCTTASQYYRKGWTRDWWVWCQLI